MEDQNATRPTADAPASPALKKTFGIKVVGVGGAGCNAVTHMAGRPLQGVAYIVMNTDLAALSQSGVETKINLGAKTMRGLGAGGEPERGRSAAEEDSERIRELCQGADVVFVVAGLGGGTGTGASPVVARIAKEAGALVLALVVLPFECEGGRRQRQANMGLAELKSAADAVITLPNEKIKKLADENASLLGVFGITNELVAQGVRSIWRLLERPGLVNVDFGDLCAVTRGRHAESVLAIAEAKGENRARQIVDRLMAHPLMEAGQVLNEAGNVLVSITSGPSLTLNEVEHVLEQVRRQCEHAHIIMGTAIDETMTDALVVTLVASRRHGGLTEGGPRTTEASTQTAPDNPELSHHLLDPNAVARATSRFIPPPPVATAQVTEHLMKQNGGTGGRRRSGPRWRQGQLQLEIISKGRFEKSEPTIHQGQDLDLPTYIRRGVSLN